MTGRPTKFDQQTADLIVTLVERGVPRHRAAAAAGISKSTLQLWIKKGREEQTVDPDDHTKKQLQAIASQRNIHTPSGATKADIADAINDNRSPFSDFSDRLYAADSRFYAAAVAKMQDVGADDWRQWQASIHLRFPETRPGAEAAGLTEPEDVGTEHDAQRQLERAEAIRVKMLGTGTDG
jgi:hypothetical protein